MPRREPARRSRSRRPKNKRFQNTSKVKKLVCQLTKKSLKRHLIQMAADSGIALKLFPLPAFVSLHGEIPEKLGVSSTSLKH